MSRRPDSGCFVCRWNTLPLLFVLTTALVGSAWVQPKGQGESVPSLAPDSIETISEVRVDVSGDAVPDRLGDTVAVAGRAVVQRGMFVPLEFTSLQDATGGIHVFLPDRPTIRRGDSLVVRGVVEHKYGLTQLRALEHEVVDSAGIVPPPLPLTVAAAEDETYEGEFVRVQGKILQFGSNDGGKYAILGDRGQQTPAQIAVFVSNRHLSRIELGRFEAGDEIAVTGVLGQYDFSEPYTEYYQVLPRERADLTHVGLGSTYLWTVLYVLGGAGIVAIVAILMLRSAVKRRTRELEESKARFRRLAEATVEGIILHEEGEVIDVNDALAEMVGEEQEELVGRGVEIVLENTIRDMEDEFPEGLCERATEAEIVRSDGTTIPVEIESRDVSAGDRTVHVVALRDIAERKERERKRRALAAAVEQARESIVLTNTRSVEKGGPQLMYANAAFEDMWGYEVEESIGAPPNLIMGPETEEEVLADFMEHLRAGRPWQGKMTNHRKDGSTLIAEWSVAPVTDQDDQLIHWVSVQRDVTDEHERKEALRAAKEEAEEASRLKSAMLANMSHEIRTPLTSVIGFAEAIDETVDDLEKHHKSEDARAIGRFARLIETGGRRLLETLDGVLNLSKLEAGDMELSREPINLAEEARETTALFERRARKANLELHVEMCADLIWAEADQGGVQIILRNLLSNALKYNSEGGQVWVRVRNGEGSVVLEVEDTGIGMLPSKVSTLFQAFKQESEGKGREYEGTGLGLAITKRVVEEMDGTIEVETEKGEGSKFVVTLPRFSSEAEVGVHKSPQEA